MQLDLLQEGTFPNTPKDPTPSHSLKSKALSASKKESSLDLLQDVPLIPRSTPLQFSSPSKELIQALATPVMAEAKNVVGLAKVAGPDQEPTQMAAKSTDSSEHPDKAEKHLPEKNPDALKTISEAATFLGVPQHVLRFWESRFNQIKPLKMAGGRRYYRPDDMEILTTIKHLLYKQGYTIKGAKKAFSSLKKPKNSESVADVLTQPIQPFPEIKPKALNKKQISQLSVIRQELIGLRETLTPLIY